MAKVKFSKKIITGVSITLILFIIADLIVFWHTGSEPQILTGAVFGAAINQYWTLAGIKKAEIRKGETNENRLENETDKP